MTEIQTTDPIERFQNFLKSFQNKEIGYKYRQKIAQISIKGINTILIDFDDLMIFDLDYANKILEKPDEYIKYTEDACLQQLKIEDSEYSEKVKRIHVWFKNIPEKIQLRFLGVEHIRKLISFEGILVRSTTIQPMLVEGFFRCRRCGIERKIKQEGLTVEYPNNCDCQRSGQFDLVIENSEFINSQQIRVQEKPEDLPPGQLPRYIDVKIVEDLVDMARPGDRICVTGILRTFRERSFGKGFSTTFGLYIDVKFIEVSKKEEDLIISKEDEEKFLELQKDPLIYQKLVSTIAPSIYGYQDIKEAILYLLFGGVPKNLPDKISIRGDINVLIIGDPGTAKSQLLQYVSKIAPRGLYTSGRGSTAAGLTAAVMKEKDGGMSLEAGALVLADKGVCAIDEMDKMRSEDRVSIHEAMEQQTVSVAKGGIIATLNARTSILAAANPALGRYDSYRTMAENINLPVTILSRFDLIFVIKDVPEREVDEHMAEHILTLHKTGMVPIEPPIQPEILHKYIYYAKRINPRLNEEAMKRLQDFYLQMRRMESKDSPIAITARQLESLIRLAEARAKAKLKEEVTIDDAQAAILLMQKSLEQVGIDLSSGKIDIDLIMTGKPKSLREQLQIILSTLVEMEKGTGIVNEENFYDKVKESFGIDRNEASRLINQLAKDGTIYYPKQGYLKKT